MLRAVLVPAVAAVALAGAPATGPSSEANTLYEQARQTMLSEHPECESRPVAPTRVSSRQPQSPLLDMLAPLRRPSTALDRSARRLAFDRLNTTNSILYLNYTRVVRAADGQRIMLVPDRVPVVPGDWPVRCDGYLDKLLGPLTRGQPAAVRRDVATLEHQLVINRQDDIDSSEHDGVAVGDYPTGGGLASSAYTFIRRRGLLDIADYTRHVYWIDGVVPDGVAKVTVSFPRSVRFEGLVLRNGFGFSASAAVRNNVVRFRMPQEKPAVLGYNAVWRSAGGQVLATFTSIIINLVSIIKAPQ
jgi:hypothetical protein